MKYNEATINDLFQYDEFQKDHLEELGLKVKVKKIREEVARRKPQVVWKKLIDEVLENSGKLLNIKISDILKGGWKKHEEVSKYLGEAYKEKDDVFLVPLLEHTITSFHEPKVKVELGDLEIGVIDFEIKLKFKLKGAILKIAHAEIKETQFGSIQFEGTFSCEEIVLWDEKSKDLNFD